MKQKKIDPRLRMAILFFVLLFLVAIPLTLVIRARVEMGQ